MNWVNDLIYNHKPSWVDSSLNGIRNAWTVGNMPEFVPSLKHVVDGSPYQDPYAGQPQPPQPQQPNSGMGGPGSGINSQMGPNDAILQQLQQLQDPSRYYYSPDQLQQQAQYQADMQYDPLIQALQNSMTSATQRGQRNSNLIGSMFNQLSDQTAAQAPVIAQQFDQSKQKTGDQYQNLQNNINSTYDNAQKQQSDLMSRLNIQAAAADPTTFNQQNTDRAHAVTQAQQQGAAANTALEQQKQGAVNYTNMGAQADKAEGVQRQGDLMYQLSDLLNQAQGQINNYQAQKTTAVGNNMYNLQMQMMQMGNQRAQQDFNNYMSTVNLQRNMTQDYYNQYKFMNQPVQSLANIGYRVAGMGLPQSSAQNIQNVMDNALYDPTIMSGVDPSTMMNLTPEAKAQKIMDAGQAQGLNSQELNALQTIALEYFGRR